MWPTLYEVQGTAGAVGIHSYGLLVLCAVVAGVSLAGVKARDMGLPMEKLPAVLFLAVLGGFLGARLLYVVGVWDLSSLFSVTGGLAWYGGLIGGAAMVLAVGPRIGVDGWKFADAVAPGLAIGAAVGRMGCFFAGCCHGVALAHPDPKTALLPDGALQGQLWAHPHFPFVSAEFQGGVARVLDVPVYPTQLWQSVGSFLILMLLLAVGRNRRFDGHVAAVFLVTEPVLRFIVEAFRGDHRGYAVQWSVEQVPSWLPGLSAAGGDVGDVIGLTTSQGIAVGMILLGASMLWLRRRVGVAPETAVADAWVDDLVD